MDRKQRSEVVAILTIIKASGLIHGFTLSTTTDSNDQHPVRGPRIGYEVCGYAAKDHSNQNEGEVKEFYATLVELANTSAFHAED